MVYNKKQRLAEQGGLQPWQRVLALWPGPWPDRLRALEPLYEEKILWEWAQDPARFGPEGAALWTRLTARERDLRWHLERALDACKYHGVGAQRAPSPQLQEALGQPECAGGDPYQLLVVLGRTKGSLLRRAAGGAALVEWPEPRPMRLHRNTLLVASGPRTGLEMYFNSDGYLALRRVDGENGLLYDGSHSLDDPSIAGGSAEDPAVRLHLAGRWLSVLVARGYLFWNRDIIDVSPRPLEEGRLKRFAVDQGSHLFRVGATLLRLVIVDFSPMNVYVEGSPRDIDFVNELCSHLEILQNEGLVKILRVGAGKDYRMDAKRCMDEAGVIIQLLSVDYITNRERYFELEHALQLEQEGSHRVWRFLLRDFDTRGRYSVRPVPRVTKPLASKPIATWDSPSKAWSCIAAELRDLSAPMA